MMAGIPSRMRIRYGIRSRSRSWSRLTSIWGRWPWESWSAEPCPGKCLAVHSDTGVRHAARVRGGEEPRGGRVRAEGPRPDDARLGVGVHVRGGREVHVDAQRRQLPARGSSPVRYASPGTPDAPRARLPGETDVSSLIWRTQPPSWSVATNSGMPNLPARRQLLHARDVPREGRQVGDVAREDLHAADLPGCRSSAGCPGTGRLPASRGRTPGRGAPRRSWRRRSWRQEPPGPPDR